MFILFVNLFFFIQIVYDELPSIKKYSSENIINDCIIFHYMAIPNLVTQLGFCTFSLSLLQKVSKGLFISLGISLITSLVLGLVWNSKKVMQNFNISYFLFCDDKVYRSPISYIIEVFWILQLLMKKRESRLPFQCLLYFIIPTRVI